MSKLTNEQKAFCRHYVSDPKRNRANAMKAVGVDNHESAKVMACRWLKLDAVKAEIARLESEQAGCEQMEAPASDRLPPLPPKSAPPPGSRRPPVMYSPELAARICELTREGYTLSAIADSEDMPAVQTILKWAGDGVEGRPEFAREYAAAVKAGLRYRLDQKRRAWDDATAPGSKVNSTGINALARATDYEKWLAACKLPDEYGNKPAPDSAPKKAPDTRSPAEVAESIRRLCEKHGLEIPAHINLPKPTVPGVDTPQ